MTAFTIVGASPAADDRDFYRALLAGSEAVIAADAAGEWCVALGRVPDLTIGDFDSAADGAVARLVAAGSRVVELPAEKDVSDLDAALERARRLGAQAVTFTAAFSDRIDHTLAALGTVLSAADLELGSKSRGGGPRPSRPPEARCDSRAGRAGCSRSSPLQVPKASRSAVHATR